MGAHRGTDERRTVFGERKRKEELKNRRKLATERTSRTDGTMVTDCGPSFTKCFLTLLNFVFFFSSSVILILGCWLYSHKESFMTLTQLGLENQHVKLPTEVAETIQEINQPLALEQLAHGLLYLGGFVFLVSMVGYCGASKESRFLLVLYSLFLTVIIGSQIFLIGITCAYRYEVERSTKSLLRSSLENHFSVSEKPNAVSLAWNFVMAEFQCCGVDNYTDFQRSRTFLNSRSSHQILPPACCILNQEQYPPYFEPEDTNCLSAPTSYNSYFLKGCYDKLFTRILAHLNPVLITIICLVTLELLAIIFALCLSKAVDRDLRILK